jgi:uncharacterized protein (DUF433 family)
MMEVFPGITADPDVRFGKLCVAGTRIDVATVVGLFAAATRRLMMAFHWQATGRDGASFRRFQGIP